MNNPMFKFHLVPLALAGIFMNANALEYADQGYPKNVGCQLSLDVTSSSDPVPIDAVARTCNDFRVQNEFELNFVKGACILGGTLSGLIYSFNESRCKSENAAAFCRVQIQSTGEEEVTWYFEPESPQGNTPTHEDKFRASCDDLGGIFTKLKLR